MSEYVAKEIIDLDDYSIPDLPFCPECATDIIRACHWRVASVQERQEMLEDGFVRAHLDDVCFKCRPPANPVYGQADRRQGRSMEVYQEMIATGHTIQEVADKLGIKRKTVLRMVSDAKKRGKL